MEWLFDGIGTELVSLLIGGFLGGTVGYKIGIKNKTSQRQKGKNNVVQTQIGNIVNNGSLESGR